MLLKGGRMECISKCLHGGSSCHSSSGRVDTHGMTVYCNTQHNMGDSNCNFVWLMEVLEKDGCVS